MSHRPLAAAPTDGSTPPALSLRNGSAWVVHDTRVRWSIARDGHTARVHSPQPLDGSRPASKHNLLKVTTRGPVATGCRLVPGVVNAVIAHAMSADEMRTIRLTETEDGQFTITMCFPGSQRHRLGQHRPRTITGGSITQVRQVLAELDAVEDALRRVTDGRGTDTDLAVLRAEFPELAQTAG